MSGIAASPPVAAAPRRLASLLAPALFFVLMGAGPFLVDAGTQGFALSLLTRVAALALAALSLDLLVGYGAMVSFGHAAFIGIGAYAVAICSSYGIEEIFVQGLAAVAVAAFYGAATGAISLRTRGVNFIMITLAFGQMVFFLATSLTAWGGDDGVTLSRRSAILGTRLLDGDMALYYVSLATLLIAYLFLRVAVGSRFGRVLRGLRDNATRMRAIGYEPFGYQLFAYVLAAVLAAIAGVLIANQSQFVSPATMAWTRSGDLIFMVVMGGQGTLHGALIGAAAFILIEEVLSHHTENWRMIFGPLLILLVVFARGGLMSIFGGRR